MIAAQRTGAGSNQVTDACEPGKGQGMSASGDAQAREFSQPTCDKGGFGVISHIHAIIDTRANCNNVLERPSELNAYNIMCRVDSIVSGSKQNTGAHCHFMIVGRYDSRGRLSLRYFARNIGTAQSGNPIASIGQFFTDDFGHSLQAANLYALAGIYKYGVVVH